MSGLELTKCQRSVGLDLLSLIMNSPRPNVIVICSPTGWGKTTICRWLLDKSYTIEKFSYSLQSNQASIVSSDFPIPDIAREIDQRAALKQPGWISFRNWLERTKSAIIQENMRKEVLETLKSALSEELPFISAFIEIFSGRLRGPKHHYENIIAMNYDHSHLVLREYLIENFRYKPAIIRIENFQRLDIGAKGFLSLLLAVRENQENLLIGEYTTGDDFNGDRELLEIAFEENAIRQSHFINLEPQDFMDLVNTMNLQNNINLSDLQARFISKNFNIRQVLNFINLKSKSSKQMELDLKTKDPTSILLSSLSNAEISMLSIIAANGGAASQSLLESIDYEECKFVNSATGSFALDTLCRSDLLHLERSYYRFVHDSDAIAVLKQNDSNVSRSAVELLRNHYAKMVDNLAEAEIETMVFALSRILILDELLGNFDEILQRINQLKGRIHKIEFPKRVITALLDANDQITTAGSRGLIDVGRYQKLLANLLFNKRLYKDCLIVQRSIVNKNEYDHLLEAAVNNRQDRHLQAISICDALLNIPHTNIEVKISSNIIKIFSHRSRNEYEKAYQVFDDAIRYYASHASKTAAYLLRTAEIVLPYDASLSYLDTAIERFEILDDKFGGGLTHVDKAMQLGRLGELASCHVELDFATKCFENYPSEIYLVRNNRACARLYEGATSDDIEDDFRYALRSTTLHFDLVAINSNLLIFYGLRQCAAGMRDCIEQISFYQGQYWRGNGTQVDKALLLMISQNLSWAYNILGDEFLHQEYKRRYQDLLVDSEFRWKMNAFPMARHDRRHYFMDKFPYEICWISGWYFSLPETVDVM